jgi:hypothetical protein
MTYHIHSPTWTRKAGSFLGAIALGTAAVVLPGCGDVQEIADGKTNVTTEDLEPIAQEDEGAPDLLGQEVSIRGTVDQPIGSDSDFVLTSEDGVSILVINTTGEMLNLPTEDMRIQATGDVAEFVIADVESEYGLTFDDPAYGDYEGQPAIVAESLALAPTTEQLTETPEAFYDQVIAMEGDVRNIYSPSAFDLFEEGWVDDIGIVIVGAESDLKSEGSNLQEDERVVVTGMARPFDAEALQQEYNLGLSPDVLAEFQERYNRPVLVADDVYPSALDN